MAIMTELLVTGATGHVGGLVVDALVERGVRPRVLVRDVARAPRLDVDVFVGDFTDPSTLTGALEGVDAAFLVSPADPQQRALQSGFARAAAAVGSPHIVKLSGLGTTLDSYVASGRWHAETEQDIRDLGLPFTFLQPYFFMQNLAAQVRSADEHRVVRSASPDAKIAMVDTRDIAEVAAAALMGEPTLRNEAVVPTAEKAVTMREVAGLLAEALDAPVEVVTQTEAESRAAFERAGMPPWRQDNLLQFNRAFAEGLGATVTDVVLRVTGNRPRSVEDFIREALAARRGG